MIHSITWNKMKIIAKQTYQKATIWHHFTIYCIKQMT